MGDIIHLFATHSFMPYAIGIAVIAMIIGAITSRRRGGRKNHQNEDWDDDF